MTTVCEIYERLGEAEAIRVHGKVTARHPVAFPLDGLLLLKHAADRYGQLIGNRERVTFAEWADRIEGDAIASIDEDRQAVAEALRAMHRAAKTPSSPVSLVDRLRRLRRQADSPSPRDFRHVQ